ncbi:MAG TPA: GAF and ANTAR domain-containing protein [Pseudonocardiaceae bacterium]|jgi:hypothetical protein|nr:GAF and ANTAR domain-containing protein [Pseudonocardiaceae bacterium]
MAGFGDGASRHPQVRAWVAERAASLRLPVSVGLLCETAVVRLGVSGAAVTVDNAAGWAETRHTTDTLSTRLAELQVTVGEGPCTDAHRAGSLVLVADLDSPASQRRWPLFAPLAVDAGACALFALPLCVGTIQVGILALHQLKPGQLTAPTLTDALAFAALARRLLLDEQAGLPNTDGDPADALALHSPQVHQATGMIAAQLDEPMQDAFSRLRARAFTSQQPLAELAADVVARRVRFDHPDEAT